MGGTVGGRWGDGLGRHGKPCRSPSLLGAPHHRRENAWREQDGQWENPRPLPEPDSRHAISCLGLGDTQDEVVKQLRLQDLGTIQVQAPDAISE